MKKTVYLLLTLGIVLLTGCKTSKRMAVSPLPAETAPATVEFLSSELQLIVPTRDGNTFSVKGNMKMKGGERVQISLLMPILRTEVARIEVTPEEALFLDRMNKRFARITRTELNSRLSADVEFRKLEKLLVDAAHGGRQNLTGKELGLRSLEKAEVQFYNFSTEVLNLSPTEVSSRYTQVSLEEIMILLKDFL